MTASASTRDRILAAAVRAFVAGGYAGARIDAIAKDAGCNKQLIYHHFGDKKGLYAAVVDHELACKPMPVAMGPEAFAWQALEPFRSAPLDRDWFRLMMWEALEGGEIIGEDARRLHINAGRELIQQAQRDGWITNEIDPEALMVAVMAISAFPFLMPQMVRLVTGREPSDADFRDRYEPVILRLLGALVREPEPAPDRGAG